MSASAKSPTAPAIVGHDALLASLGRAIRDETLPATVLVHGARGCGKQTLALWMARANLCREPAPLCERCTNCRLALRLEHADIHWYFPLPRPKGASSPAKMAEALEDAVSRGWRSIAAPACAHPSRMGSSGSTSRPCWGSAPARTSARRSARRSGS